MKYGRLEWNIELIIAIELRTSQHSTRQCLRMDKREYYISMLVKNGGRRSTQGWASAKHILRTAQKACILGNMGSSEVTAVENLSGGVTFVKVIDSGNVMVTAITSSGEAVHSRNGTMVGKLIPSQYYGKRTVE